VSLDSRAGATSTEPSGLKSKRVIPPNAAMYWSCLPTVRPSRSISISQASRPRSDAETWLRCMAWTALSSPTVNEPDEPRPVPEGMSAVETISTLGPTSWARSTSRTIGCSMWSGLSTRSSWLYLRK
jgi:hypothetical protein